MEVSSKRWSEEKLFEMRKEVLRGWPTANEVDLKEAIEYRRTIPSERNKVDLNRKVLITGKPFVEKTVGRTTIEEQIEHSQVLVEAGVDVIDIFTDTYTRKNQFKKAEAGIIESKKEGRSLLNGYPIVNHGVKESRKVIESVDVPTRIWSGCDEDPRLIQEISLAAGFTQVGFSNIIDLIAHSRDYPLDLRIRNDQYCTRLASYYVEQGFSIDLFAPSGLHGYDPPDMKAAVLIPTVLLAAEQGVKDISVSFLSTVNLNQMVAALRVIRKLLREYLDRFGHPDVNINLGFGTWHGDWPLDPYLAAAVNAWDVSIALLAGVDGLWLKSIGEAAGIPARESDIPAIKIAKKLIDVIGRQRLDESEELKLEEHMMTMAVKAIVDKMLDLGDGDVARGMIRAVEAGVIDTTLSPWIYLARKVLEVRDINGAIRYVDHGNIPLPKEVVEYHREKIAAREKKDGVKAGIEMLIQDVTCVSRDIIKGYKY
jgi:methylaspartate mutase epsilon subunit